MAVKSMKLARSQMDRDKRAAKCSLLEKRVRRSAGSVSTLYVSIESLLTGVRGCPPNRWRACARG